MVPAVSNAIGEAPSRKDGSLVIRFLGGFAVEIDGEHVTSPSYDHGNAGNRILTAILAFLVDHMDRPVARRTLADVFWPDTEGDRASNSLSRSLSGLRKVLATQLDRKLDLVVVRNGDQLYWLRAKGPYWKDKDAFIQKVEAGERLKEAGNLESALHEFEGARDLYKGDYLTGMAYDSWCLPRRTRLRELYHVVLFELSDIYERTNKRGEAIEHLFRVLESDSANESAYLRLMELHLKRGNRSEALGIYDVCCRVLRERFGLQPGASLDALRSWILTGEEIAHMPANHVP